MAKKRVYEIAKEKGVSSKELLAALQAAGVDVKAAASTIEEADAVKVLSGDGANGSGDGAKPPAPQQSSQPAAAKQQQQRPPAQPQARPAQDQPRGGGPRRSDG